MGETQNARASRMPAKADEIAEDLCKQLLGSASEAKCDALIPR